MPKNENPNKIVKTVEKTLNFNIHQKGKRLPSDLASIACLAKVSDHSNLKILPPKQILQRLSIALGQVKSGNILENLVNEIRQIIYFLYRAKEITKIVYNNIMNSITL